MKKKSEFAKNLEKYLKHTNLEIVFHMKDGQKVKLNGRRKMVNDNIVMYYGEEEGLKVPVSEIASADIYAL